MKNTTLKRVARVIADVEKGVPLKDAIKSANMSAGTYYKFKDRVNREIVAKPKRPYKKKQPTLETIVAPKNSSRLAVVVGDTESILEILKGLN